MDKIKAHIKKHKTVYCCIVTGVAVAGITCLITRGRVSRGWYSSQQKGAAGVLAKPSTVDLSNFSGNNNVVTTTINHERKNPLSYIVSQDGTENWWRSQADTARATGILESDLSKHLNHGKKLPNDLSFTREGIAN